MWPSKLRMRHIVLGVLSLVAGVLLTARLPARAAVTATESVQSTIDEVVRILENKELKNPDRAEERRRQLEKVIGDRFSYDEMAKRALGAQWVKLDEKQRQEFVRLFQRLLSSTYAGKIEGYSGEQVKYLNERLKEGYAEVRTKITAGKAEVPLDYRLLNTAGEWRVYDVVVDGISLVNNYRGQFSKILRSSSYEDLVEKLRNKSETFAAPKEEKR